ncbi:DUF308 domain-containing protein [Massilia dura]|uniref:DUF308 domain-containing protein n=1 Tax=Pseudoduganella dura TaxID=321982 RepID=A0A6I3XIF3_9BURK|nr:DUF308 domain-containing protein [Pseudoduganella dura]MUI11475.1 DUF308 domain-containing protein [Pseudoduganella dura]GGX97477.1 membrane protein [Pseudoduganella dura]
MSLTSPVSPDQLGQERWLRLYYATRAAFSLAWVVAALTAGQHVPAIAAALLVCYPAWDALANAIDARRSGGMAYNRTQAANIVASAATALALLFVLPDMHRVLAIFGAWAIVAGLLQLATALRRWKQAGAQWTMVLSGAQSALAGTFFIVQAQGAATPSILTVTGYAGFGAVYFLVSAVWLHAGAWRRKPG